MIKTSAIALATVALLGGLGCIAYGTTVQALAHKRDVAARADTWDQQHKVSHTTTYVASSMASYEGQRVTSGWHKGVN